MNRQFHNKQQSLTVTGKQETVDKLFDWSKNFTGHMFNTKLEEKSYKMSFKALPSPRGQIGLRLYFVIVGIYYDLERENYQGLKFYLNNSFYSHISNALQYASHMGVMGVFIRRNKICFGNVPCTLQKNRPANSD